MHSFLILSLLMLFSSCSKNGDSGKVTEAPIIQEASISAFVGQSEPILIDLGSIPLGKTADGMISIKQSLVASLIPSGLVGGKLVVSGSDELLIISQSGCTSIKKSTGTCSIKVRANTQGLEEGNTISGQIFFHLDENTQEETFIQISATVGNAPVVETPALVSSSSSAAFGSLSISDSSKDLILTYKALSALKSTDEHEVVVPAPFVIQAASADRCSNKTISKGASCTVKIRFDPKLVTSNGLVSGNITFAGLSIPVSATISGNPEVGQPDQSQLAWIYNGSEISSLDLGTLLSSNIPTKFNLYLKNKSASSEEVNVSFSGTGFTIINRCIEKTLAPQAQCSLEIRPEQSEGVKSVAISVEDQPSLALPMNLVVSETGSPATTYQTVETTPACSSLNLQVCGGTQNISKSYVCEQYVGGVKNQSYVSNQADCSPLANMSPLSCQSPSGSLAVVISGGTKNVTCSLGSNIQNFVSVTCSAGNTPSGESCIQGNQSIANGKILFNAYDADIGTELWGFDITNGQVNNSAHLVKNINTTPIYQDYSNQLQILGGTQNGSKLFLNSGGDAKVFIYDFNTQETTSVPTEFNDYLPASSYRGEPDDVIKYFGDYIITIVNRIGTPRETIIYSISLIDGTVSKLYHGELYSTSMLNQQIVNGKFNFVLSNSQAPDYGRHQVVISTDGTVAGTSIVDDINFPNAGSYSQAIVAFSGSDRYVFTQNRSSSNVYTNFKYKNGVLEVLPTEITNKMNISAGNKKGIDIYFSEYEGRYVVKKYNIVTNTLSYFDLSAFFNTKTMYEGTEPSYSIGHLGKISDNFLIINYSYYDHEGNTKAGLLSYNIDNQFISQLHEDNNSSFTFNYATENYFYFDVVDSNYEILRLVQFDRSLANPTMSVIDSIPYTYTYPNRLSSINGRLFIKNLDTVSASPWYLFTLKELNESTKVSTLILDNVFTYERGRDPTLVGSRLVYSTYQETQLMQVSYYDGVYHPSVEIQVQSSEEGSSPSLSSSVTLNGKTIFSATKSNEIGSVLMSTDGTSAGTIELGLMSAFNFVVFKNKVYFNGTTPTTGSELFVTDGTPQGTTIVKDINIGTLNSSPASLTVVNPNLMCLLATTSSNGREIWCTDGTEEGTALVKDNNSGTVAGAQLIHGVMNGKLYFTGNNGSSGNELFVTDGTEAGTTLVKDVNPGTVAGFSALIKFDLPNSKMYFTANHVTYGQELWVTDGTESGTTLVKDINAGTIGASISASNSALLNGKLYFTANHVTYGQELWVTDGTESGTNLVADLNPNSSSSSPSLFALANGTLYFRANNGTSGNELFKLSNNNIELVSDYNAGSGAGYSNLFAIMSNGKLLITCNNATYGIEICVVDSNGMSLLKDIRVGSSSSSPSNSVVVDNLVFFSASTPNEGNELWVTDGTESGTFMVEDIVPGTQGSNPHQILYIKQ